MLSSKNPDTWNRHESIESTVTYKPRMQGKQDDCHIKCENDNRKVEVDRKT